MVFNSLAFVVIFPLIVIVYYAIPEKIKNIFLFFVSLCFYACFKIVYVPLLLGVISISYFSAVKMDGKTRLVKQKILLANVIIMVGMLLSFKGTNTLPLGVSFYTFVAIGYLIDVYREKISAEKDFIAVGTFMAFFPPLLSGPIERADNLLHQIKSKKIFDEERILIGFCQMLWGYFQKVVIADRIAVIVNAVYDNDAAFTGIYIVVATVLYAFQIYCDFAGYSNLAIGASGILGIELRKNFNVPYKATNISEFWDRWHISLSTWLRDYVYISLGGNRKGQLKKYRNLLITFLVSGIWHGMNWTFIVWGTLHGVYNIIHSIIVSKRNDLHKWKVLKVLGTFLLVDFAWLFFRANSLEHAFRLIKKMIFELDFLSVLKYEMAISMGMELLDIAVLIIALVILILVDLTNERVRYCKKIIALPLWARWCVFYVMIFSILIFGYYGPGFNAAQFIYAQF